VFVALQSSQSIVVVDNGSQRFLQLSILLPKLVCFQLNVVHESLVVMHQPEDFSTSEKGEYDLNELPTIWSLLNALVQLFIRAACNLILIRQFVFRIFIHFSRLLPPRYVRCSFIELS